MVKKLQGLLWAIGMVSGMAASAAAQEPLSPGSPALPVGDSPVETLRERPQPTTTVKEWLAQIEAATVQVTGVKLERSETGLDIVLETAAGKPLQVDATKFRREGNNLIAEIPNAVLALPEGQAFTAENPTADIATVQVVQRSGNIRVSVAGNNALPKTEVTLKTGGLAYSLNPEGDEPDEEIVVTGDRQRGYRVPNTSTATKTDTPIRDIPQSIQVVPQQVLRDRKPRNLTEAVETVSGVIDAGDIDGSSASSRTIRGFEQPGNFRNGFRDAPNTYILSSPIENVEQIEVLKGPASVLFGDIEPGGIVNITTKQPLSEPFYELGLEIGNRNFYQPSVDFSGPLTSDKNLLYRFVAGYQSSGSFQDFVSTNQFSVAPSLAWKIGDRTDLKVYYDYNKFNADTPVSYSLLLSDGSLTPRNLFTSYPNFFDSDQSAQRFGLTLTHKFNDDWQLRTNFSGLIAKVRETPTYVTSIQDDQFATIESYDLDYGYNNYFGQVDVLGKFKTGSVSHQLLTGFDVNDFTDSYIGDFNTNLPLLDLSNPNYNVPTPSYEPFFQFENRIRSYGLYVQDQIAFGEQFKLLVGGRYDWGSSVYETGEYGAFGDTTDEPTRNSSAFSPRIGLVYQPNDTISLYASYSSSFRAQTGFNSSTNSFDPTRGTQYEVGIKADWLDGKLSTTLAAYRLTKTNVITTDPNNPQFSIQTGEQRSQGIELDIAGEILPGWKVIASYAYTDAKVTEDNSIPVGNRLNNVPENQASLWTTYEIQQGDLKGLGFGVGLFYVGERQGDLSNSFQLKDYLRTDAVLYYRRDRFKAALNIRNLFDIDYAKSSFGPVFINRGEPFTITGSISWEF